MNLLKWFILQIEMCFRFYVDPPAAACADAAAAAAAANPPAPPPPVNADNLTMEQLKGIIGELVKTGTKEEIENGFADLKKEITETNRANIFPGIEGKFGEGGAEAGSGSIIDTRVFNKAYSSPDAAMIRKYQSMAPWLPYGMVMGNELKSMNAPFKKLSPEMEGLAKVFKCKGSVQKATEAFGFDVHNHNDKQREYLKQAGMNEGAIAAGGTYVPVEFLATVIEFATAQSTILQKVWRMPMTTQTMRIPRLVQAAGSYFGGITLYSPDEGEMKESTYPESERLALEAKKLIGLIYLTDELIADSMINIVNYVTGLMVRAFQYELERRVLLGTGVGPCLGIINDPAINIVPRQQAMTVGYQDIINLDNAIDENFTDLSWMTRKVTQNTLLGLRDTNNRPIFMADYGVFTGQPLHPPSMITYPVHRTRNLPQMGTAGDLTLGDLSWYMLAIRQDLTVDQSSHVRFIYDEETLRFVMRLDGMPAISIAFAILSDVES